MSAVKFIGASAELTLSSKNTAQAMLGQHWQATTLFAVVRQIPQLSNIGNTQTCHNGQCMDAQFLCSGTQANVLFESCFFQTNQVCGESFKARWCLCSLIHISNSEQVSNLTLQISIFNQVPSVRL